MVINKESGSKPSREKSNSKPGNSDKRVSTLADELRERANNKARLQSTLAAFRQAGREVDQFSESVDLIILSIKTKKDIKGVFLHEKIQNPNYRFISSDDPFLSGALSETYALLAEQSIAVGYSEGSKKGTSAASTKRSSSADEYAKNAYSIIENVRYETGVFTLRGTVEELNKKGIDAPNGGKWNKSSLQLIEKRWKELGLTPSPKPEKQRKTRPKPPQ